MIEKLQAKQKFKKYFILSIFFNLIMNFLFISINQIKSFSVQGTIFCVGILVFVFFFFISKVIDNLEEAVLGKTSKNKKMLLSFFIFMGIGGLYGLYLLYNEKVQSYKELIIKIIKLDALVILFTCILTSSFHLVTSGKYLLASKGDFSLFESIINGVQVNSTPSVRYLLSAVNESSAVMWNSSEDKVDTKSCKNFLKDTNFEKNMEDIIRREVLATITYPTILMGSYSLKVLKCKDHLKKEGILKQDDLLKVHIVAWLVRFNLEIVNSTRKYNPAIIMTFPFLNPFYYIETFLLFSIDNEIKSMFISKILVKSENLLAAATKIENLTEKEKIKINSLMVKVKNIQNSEKHQFTIRTFIQNISSLY